MPSVVITAWDPITLQVSYVPVAEGDGGDVHVASVGESEAAEVSAACDAISLPAVGELVEASGACLIQLTGPSARWCTIKVGRGGQVRLSEPGSGFAQNIAATRLGLPTADVVQRMERTARFLLFERPIEGTDAVGCWVIEGGLTAWLKRDADRRQQAAMEKEQKKAEKERQQRDATRFINPYTFVPFPAAIAREKPAGHDRMGEGRMSGRLRVRWEFVSPWQAPDGAVDGETLGLPGSSVKGALRSVHEVLAGGCLRVLDSGFVPSYRDPATVPAEDWTLAVVEETTADGQPLAVRTAEDMVWVRSAQLVRACRNGLRTGSRVGLDPAAAVSRLQRRELPAHAQVSAGGDWVVLLSDPGARRPKREDGSQALYFAACGLFTDASPICEVDDRAWQAYRRAVAGARDVVKARQTGSTPMWVPVEFPKGDLIGRRKPARERLAVGDVLWVRRGADDRVVGLKLSVLWRHVGVLPSSDAAGTEGVGSLGGRVPPHLHACVDPDGAGLCPSCRLFGAADTRARDQDGAAAQRSYAGHVRFGDALSVTGVALTPVTRVPLGAPRPGAGQFYLSYTDPRPAGAETDPPTREWGARPDRGGPRQVRGRKFYWHADPSQQEPARLMAQPHHSRQMTAERWLAPTGTTLVQTITFDNLDAAELGGLLAVLEPQRALKAGSPLRLHLGGGKPLGLGSCTATVEEFTVWTAGSRYGRDPAPQAEPDGAVRAFTASCPVEVTATWPALAAVLAAETVDAARVWYPPGADWTEPDRDMEKFDTPFHFFTATSGMYLARGEPRPLLPLPDPTAEDQSLPIIHKDHLRHRPEERRR